jgi:hypothetical protein
MRLHPPRTSNRVTRFSQPLACPINHYNVSSSHHTFVQLLLFVDDNFKVMLFNLPFSTNVTPVAQRTHVSDFRNLNY